MSKLNVNLGVVVLIIAGRRRSRGNRGNSNWFQRPGGQTGHIASIRGAMPNTPLPEWINWDNESDPEHET